MVLYAGAKSSALASLVLMSYDYILVVEEEVQYVWSSPFSLSKVIYLAMRYLGFATASLNMFQLFDGISTHSCNRTLQLRIWMRMLMFILIEILLIGRVYIVYNRSKKLLIALTILFFVNPIVNIVELYHQNHASTIAHSTTHHANNSHGSVHQVQATAKPCYYVSTPNITTALLWIPILGYAFLLKVLILFRAWQVYKEKDKGLLRVIVMDSLYYYLSFFLVILFNFVVTFVYGNPQWALPWTSSIPVIAASRLFLNTRREFFRKQSRSLAEISLDVAEALNDTSDTLTGDFPV